MTIIKAPQLATAIYNYTSNNKDELSLRKGDKVSYLKNPAILEPLEIRILDQFSRRLSFYERDTLNLLSA